MRFAYGYSQPNDDRSNEIDELSDIVSRFPSFRPHRLLGNRHLQTIASFALRCKEYPYRAVSHPISLDNGDTTFLHDDRPDRWQATSPTALLVHGLSGCHQSSYMVRIAGRLNEAGVRTFRMDMRACGAGEGLSCLPYHAGCSDDLLKALQRIAQICPASPISLVGFSIGGNAALKLMGETPGGLPQNLCRSVIFNPPIDLAACVGHLSTGAIRFYDRFIVRSLYRQLRRSDRLVEHAPHVALAPKPRGQREFDDLYTAGVWGFETVDELYDETSALPVITNVRIPTLLIASRDDPLVPVEIFERLQLPPAVTMHLTDHGGHLGFVGRQNSDPDRRWMDWRIVDCITADSPSQAVPVAA